MHTRSLRSRAHLQHADHLTTLESPARGQQEVNGQLAEIHNRLVALEASVNVLNGRSLTIMWVVLAVVVALRLREQTAERDARVDNSPDFGT